MSKKVEFLSIFLEISKLGQHRVIFSTFNTYNIFFMKYPSWFPLTSITKTIVQVPSAVADCSGHREHLKKKHWHNERSESFVTHILVTWRY